MNSASRVFCLAALPFAAWPFAIFSAVASATTSVTIYSSAQPGTLSTANFQNAGENYGAAIPGYGVVRQEQEVMLNKGRTVIRISDVPAFIDPTTVSFESVTDPANTRVIEQSFEFDLTSTNKLLQKYLDREVTVEQVRGQTVESVTGISKNRS